MESGKNTKKQACHKTQRQDARLLRAGGAGGSDCRLVDPGGKDIGGRGLELCNSGIQFRQLFLLCTQAGNEWIVVRTALEHLNLCGKLADPGQKCVFVLPFENGFFLGGEFVDATQVERFRGRGKAHGDIGVLRLPDRGVISRDDAQFAGDGDLFVQQGNPIFAPEAVAEDGKLFFKDGNLVFALLFRQLSGNFDLLLNVGRARW